MAKCSRNISQCMPCSPAVTFLMKSHFVLSHAVRAMVMLYMYVQTFSFNMQNRFVYWENVGHCEARLIK